VSVSAKQAVHQHFTGQVETQQERAAKRKGGKFLTFFLAQEEYGIEILKVHEIIGMMPITRVPRTPDFILGVINLRGKVIPIVDLRLKFSMAAKDADEETCIIVVRVNGMQMGILVDKVSEVRDIASGDIEDAPFFGADVETDYIMGIGKSEGKVKLLLDIDKVLSSQEVLDLGAATGGSPNAGSFDEELAAAK
jgi:purine-binding chemotaxis protein CheW